MLEYLKQLRSSGIYDTGPINHRSSGLAAAIQAGCPGSFQMAPGTSV